MPVLNEMVPIVQTAVPVDLLPLEEVMKLMLSFVPVGFALGFICLLLGLGISGIMKIFKRV